jgi:hypothetical protein
MSTWGILIWWSESTDWSNVISNPWENPQTPWGNGTLAYFYPPSPQGSDLPERDLTIVPSLRLVLTRDGIEDFEYAAILDRLIKEEKAHGRTMKQAENPKSEIRNPKSEIREALATLRRQFETPVSWTVSEAHWQQARAAVAQAIEALRRVSASKNEDS